jgi:uncharacterized membrane protein
MTDRRLGIAIAVLGLIGLGIATYLTYVHYAHLKPICGTGGCETVQTSKYAMFVGIPVPVIGLVGWISILVSLLIPGDIGRATTALFALFGFGFSCYLTYLELVKIKAICQWCVGNAVVMTIVAALSVWRLIAYQPPVAATAQNE